MPTEFERKYVINTISESSVSENSYSKYNISQGYLIATRGITVRVRKLVEKDEKYFFTLKVNVAGRVVEIEQEMDRRDFYDLWDIALNKLEKIRYLLKHKKSTWEVDFFKDYKNETYFAVAEIELPEGQFEPESIPKIILENTIFFVPIDDGRFSNKLLGDAKYATGLLNELSKSV